MHLHGIVQSHGSELLQLSLYRQTGDSCTPSPWHPPVKKKIKPGSRRLGIPEIGGFMWLGRGIQHTVWKVDSSCCTRDCDAGG